jgi:lipopolysaccharide/colanic/teichoic acid biosynthesis glycosyltransferase
MIRFFDLFLSIIVLTLSLPVSLAIIIVNLFVTKGRPFYTQNRVGRNGVLFCLIKFRTMYSDSDSKGLITIGNHDSRVTGFGCFLRKYKLDEIPQFCNVILGDMSLVGPRPEVLEYVNLYSSEQMKILNVRPGITDYASIEFYDENEILASVVDPKKIYIEDIMPKKIELNQKFITDNSLKNYFLILFKTIRRIFIS